MGGESALRARSPKSVDEVLIEIKTELSLLQKFLIRHLLPYCRNGVGYREQSKDTLIWIVNLLRKAHWILARKLVSKGFIPDVDTYFLLTVDEVERLCNGERNPLLMSKARQRKRLSVKMEKFKFEEIVKGPEMLPRNVWLY
jgi:hypothetical protein